MLPNYYTPNSALIWVQGLESAKSYMVAPNNTVVLWDTEEQAIYIKSADAVGMPSMKILDYTVREQPTKGTEQPTSDFVTKEDILLIQKEIERIKAKLEPQEAHNEHNANVTTATKQSNADIDTKRA